MPYLTEEDKLEHSRRIDNGRTPYINNSGDLNYLVTRLIVVYLDQHDISYKTCGQIVDALDNAKDEFKRRILSPYEDLKIEQNGDVYPSLDELLQQKEDRHLNGN